MFALSSIRRTLVPLVAVTLAPVAAHAKEAELFSWSGRVDRQVLLTIRGSQVSSTNENSIQSRARFRVNSPLPMREGNVRVVREAGRGDVSVIQEPTSQNGYTAIIRIVDNQGGADVYRLSAYYEPSNSGGYGRGDNRGGWDGRDGRNDNRDERGRDDRYDRGRDNRDDRGRNGANDVAAMRWSGDVDGSVLISWRGNDVSQRMISGAPVRRANSNVLGNPIQARNGQLVLNTREGRGRVEVVQEPTLRNGYTSIIRITDPERGYGHYEITAALR